MKNQKNEAEKGKFSSEILDSIAEAVTDMNDHHLKSAGSYSELEKILDE